MPSSSQVQAPPENRSEPAAPTAGSRLSGLLRARGGQSSPLTLIAGSVLVLVFFSVYLRDAGFMTMDNVQNVIAQATVISILAVGNVFVLTAGEIDLSFANVVPFSGVVFALMIPHVGVFCAVLVGLLAGVVVGLANALLVVGLGVPSFIATLGMMEVVNGVTQWISAQASLPVTSRVFTEIFGSAQFGPVSVLVFWTLAVGVTAAWVLQRTAFGRMTAATGGNETAARYSGIRTGRVKMSVLVLNGFLASLAGLLYVGQLHGASYQYGGSSDLMLTLAAVIIGGTALAGGRGTILGAIVGSLLLGFIANGLVMMGLPIESQVALKGVIIVAAVTLVGRKTMLRT
jgi:ribose transport system permease protein